MSLTSSTTWFDKRNLVSYIVKSNPSIIKLLFNLCWIILIVFNNFLILQVQNIHCIGTITESEVAKAFNVKMPSEGAQSIMI